MLIDSETASEPPKSSPPMVVHRPKPQGIRAQIKWQFIVRWQRVRAKARSPLSWAKVIVFFLFWVALGFPVYEKSTGHGLIYTVALIGAVALKAWRNANPTMMKIVSKDYLERKTRLYGLIKAMQRRADATAEEVAHFQREALALVASYVRSHRGGHDEIYVNLLVEDGDEIVVVARDSDHRVPGARYPKSERMLAWTAIRTGKTCFTGDAPRELGVERDKAYKSILVLPVMGEQRVLGAISIDSPHRHHFDLEANDLERYLLPYVAIVGWTLEDTGAIVR